MKKTALIISAIVLLSFSFLNFAFAQNTGIPQWVKNNAGWWANGQVSDGEFINGIQWLINERIIKIPQSNNPQAPTNPNPPLGPTNPIQPIKPANLTSQDPSQTFVPNIHFVPKVTQTTIKPIKIFMIVTNYPFITQGFTYSFQARVFDASQIDPHLDLQDTFNWQQGFLEGVRIQGELLSYDNKTVIFTWNGTTNQFGYFEGQYRMENELTNQVYFVHFNATKSGMIPDSKQFQFLLVDKRAYSGS